MCTLEHLHSSHKNTYINSCFQSLSPEKLHVGYIKTNLEFISRKSHSTYSSPLPIDINFGHSHFPTKMGSPNRISRNFRTRGFCGNSTETLYFPEFTGRSRFRILGSPFPAFWGGNEVDMLGSADVFICDSENQMEKSFWNYCPGKSHLGYTKYCFRNYFRNDFRLECGAT